MGTPTLSQAAIERLERLAKSKKLTPSQVILKMLPDPDAEFETMLDSLNPKSAKISREDAVKRAVELVQEVRKKT